MTSSVFRVWKINESDARNDRIEARLRHIEFFAVEDFRFYIPVSGVAGIPGRKLQDGRRDVGRKHVALRPDAVRRLQGLVAGSRGDIEHPVTRLDPCHVEHSFGCGSKPLAQEGPPVVPCLGCRLPLLPTEAWVDIEAASDAIHEAEGFLKARKWRQAWAAAQVAYHISRRPFLVGEAGLWAEQQRERVQTIFVRAGECLAETYIWNGEPTVAIDVVQEVVAIQPYRETGYQLLMRAHAAAGNRAEALWVYERCRKLISKDFGVAPSAETHAVYLKVLQTR